MTAAHPGGDAGAVPGVSHSMAAGNHTLVVSMPDLLVALQAQKAPKGGAVR